MLTRLPVLRAALSLLAFSAAAAAFAAYSPEEIAAESAKANAFFDRIFDEELARHPEHMTSFGMKQDYDKWDDSSDAAQVEEVSRLLAAYAEYLRTIDPAKLDPQTKVSHRMWVDSVDRSLSRLKWRHHFYVVNQMWGGHSSIPAFMINQHRVDTVQDARAYIARLRGVPAKIGAMIDGILIRQEKGILSPRFAYPIVIENCRRVISGAPFDESGQPSALMGDFTRKVTALKDLDDAQRAALIEEAAAALRDSVKPAYERLIATIEAQHALTTGDHGLWNLPDGEEYYNRALEFWTTTKLTADEIHEIGLRETARLQAGIDGIRAQVGFEGDRKAFYKFLRDDPQFFLPATEEGKQQYLDRVNEVIDAVRKQLPDLFITLPKAELVVKPVEAFRERGSAQAFYERPAPDGSKPGIYYVNFMDMKALPLHQLEAIAFHEAIPGHHMQIAIAGELQGLPKFRKFGYGSGAYTEGWGLYAERLGKELGGYADPYSECGRFSMELLRAARLVVDTGIHAKRWTREQAIAWMVENTPLPEGDIVTEVNRYFVLPGQATSYMVGQLKILELRERARAAVGDRFALREFHDVVLCNGAVPLAVLEQTVDEWIAAKKG